MSTYSFNLVIEGVDRLAPNKGGGPSVSVGRARADSYVLRVLLAKPELGGTGRWRGRIQAGAQRQQKWKHSSRAA